MIHIYTVDTLDMENYTLGWSYPLEEIDYLIDKYLDGDGTDTYLMDKITGRLIEVWYEEKESPYIEIEF